jgi:acyl carrier protein
VNRDEATTLVRSVITEVAPDVDLDRATDDTELHSDLELDSMDFLNLVTAVHTATGIEIPERDYPQLATIGTFASYLVSR